MEDERKAQAAKEKAASLSKAREEQLDALKTRLLAERCACFTDDSTGMTKWVLLLRLMSRLSRPLACI